jgi:4-amino-4-deoxy-L-arabinose transferase-like glycosyltransferase
MFSSQIFPIRRAQVRGELFQHALRARKRPPPTIEKEDDVKEWRLEERWIMGFFIMGSGLILFLNLWGRSLENNGYIGYAEVAREMVRSGDWVVPHANGEVFIDKPPLLFWLIAIPSYLYGSVTPLIARLPSFFSAWIGVFILFLWGKRVFGKTWSGLMAGGILLSTYQYFFQARLAKTDILLCLFIILSLYFFYLGYEASEKRRYLFNGFAFFFMGLGVLTKGPLGLFPPLIILAVFLIKNREWKMLVSKEFILGYLILALTVLPWVLLFVHRIGLDQTITLVKENQILTRRAPIYFYFIRIWLQFFPWSLFLPFLALYLWRQGGKIWYSKESFFLVWFIVYFVILTLFKFRVSRYLLPALPPLALMMGGMERKKLVPFLIVFLLAISVWHGRECYWIKRDCSYSPGMVLVTELKPFLKESSLFAYGLEGSTVKEINFYLDPITPIPILRHPDELLKQWGESEKEIFLMPVEAFEKIQSRWSTPIIVCQEFRYKKEKLVLVSIH